MAFQGAQYGDIRANLAVSQDEARVGSTRVVNLPGGRSVTVQVPAGIRNGEEIRLPGQGEANGPGGSPGDLILQVSVIAIDQFQNANTPYSPDVTERMSSPNFPATIQTNRDSLPYYGDYAAPTAASQYTPPMQGEAYSAPATPSTPYYAPPLSEAQQPPYAEYTQYPVYGSAPPAYNQPPPLLPDYTHPPQAPGRKRSGAITATIIIVLLALLIGSGLFFYIGYYQPNQAHIAGTSTAQTQATNAANSQASSTAQVVQGTVSAAATSTAQVQATAQAFQTIYTQATSGNPNISDSMNAQSARQWDELTSTVNGFCGFENGTYSSKMPTKGYFQPCFAQNTNLHNFAMQVDMTIIKGSTGGILFRGNDQSYKYYLFRIDVNGYYDLYLYAGSKGDQAKRLLHGATDLMKPVNQANTLTLVAQNNKLFFYINQQYLDSISDGTYSSGKIGVFADSTSEATEATFANLKVWTH